MSVLHATHPSWCDFCLSRAALERIEFMVGKGANRKRAIHFDGIRSSGIRWILPFGRWRERRHALIRFAPSPTSYSVRFIAGVLRRASRRVVGVQMEIRLRTPRLPAIWPVECEAHHPEADHKFRSNSGALTPRHASLSEFGSPWEPQIRGLNAV
jgi:hypothetical protein